jgi:exodeoxyribonuclease-3
MKRTEQSILRSRGLQILCNPDERAHFRGLVELGLHSAFRLFEKPPKSWSW